MTQQITRRLFLQRVALGITILTLEPQAALKWLSEEFSKGVNASHPDNLTSAEPPIRSGELLDQVQDLIPDEKIPTQFFQPGYTQAMLEEAWRNRNLVNGFAWGLMDTHTLGGVPSQKNVVIDTDGSAVLTIRRATPQELADWDADPEKQAQIRVGATNGLEMKLSVAAFTGRLPTDIQSIEASITLPQRVVTGDRTIGMVGIGWTLWTQPDIERLAANLANLGVSPEENAEICARVNNSALEEDIAEFGLGEPSSELGDPVVLRIVGGQVLLFMAGRKTTTQKCRRADIMHVLREPMAVDIPPQLTNATIKGWLSQNGQESAQALRQPLKVKLEIGTEVYDSTRDAMVVPMNFRLNGTLLTPTATDSFPGFENDPSGNLPSNLSIWRIRTKGGSWVTIPRQFTINLCSTTRSVVKGETDSVRFSNVLITRRS